VTREDEAPPQEVLHRYPVLKRDATIRPLLGGNITQAWRIDTAAASFVLRRLPADVELATAGFTAAVHQRAAGAGLAPSLLANDAGGPVTTCSGRLFTLAARLNDAAPLSGVPDIALSHRLGQALGRLHQTLNDAPTDGASRWRLPDEPTALSTPYALTPGRIAATMMPAASSRSSWRPRPPRKHTRSAGRPGPAGHPR